MKGLSTLAAIGISGLLLASAAGFVLTQDTSHSQESNNIENQRANQTEIEVEEAYTLDKNHNGKLDTVEISFAEPVQNLKKSRIKIDGYNISSYYIHRESSSNIRLGIKEKDFNTGETPLVNFGNGALSDTKGRPTERMSIRPQDKARPVAVKLESQPGREEVYLTFSEKVASPQNGSLDSHSFQIQGLTPGTEEIEHSKYEEKAVLDLYDIINQDQFHEQVILVPLGYIRDRSNNTWEEGDRLKLDFIYSKDNDPDHDGLINETENKIGTDPEDPDTDNDGLRDGWEANGYDHDLDGEIEVPLHEYGADPLRKDIFVEVDYWSKRFYPFDFKLNMSREKILEEAATFRDGELITVGDIKGEEEVHMSVEEAFSEAPVHNPDGSTGINLHIDNGSLGGGEFIGGNYEEDVRESNITQTKLVEKYMDNARKPIFIHVKVVGSGNFWGSAGNKGLYIKDGSEEPDIDVPYNSLFVPTFMHELGHVLGINNTKVDSQEVGPQNYSSVMSYYLSNEPFLDYSREEWRKLEEKRLTSQLYK